MDPRRPARPGSWGAEPPAHLPPSSPAPYHPHPLQPGPPQRESAANPPDYSPRHQRHTSHQETYHRQDWPPGPSTNYPPPHAPATSSYEKRRNSYGSAMPPQNAPDFDRGPPLAASPPSQSSRRDHPYDMAHSSQSHQPPPPHQQVPRGGERTIIGGSPPAPYRGLHETSSVSSASSYATRHMPPPSSSPKPYQHNPNYPPPPTSRPAPTPPATSSFPSGRDLPSLSAIHRPGSSMSISSMLGGDPPRPSPEALSSRNPRAAIPVSTTTSPNYATMRAPSPPPAPSHGFSPYRGPQTPDRYQRTGPQAGREVRTDSAGTPTVSPYGSSSDPYSRAAGKDGPTSYGRHAEPPPRGAESPASQTRPLGMNYARDTTPTRSSSQSARRGPSGGHPDDHGVYGPPPVTAPRYDYGPRSNVHPGYDDRAPPPHRDERHEPYATTAPPGHPNVAAHPSPYRREYGSESREPRNDGQQGYSSRHGQPGAQPGLTAVPPPQFSTAGPDNGYPARPTAAAPYPDRSGRVVGDPAYQNRSPQKDYGPLGQPSYPSPSPSQPLDPRRLSASNATAHGGKDTPGYAPSVDSQGRKDSDDSQPPRHLTPRNLLSVGAELSRKGGRMSPLPQAVQGAQSQIGGPGGEPGIKSEFGRMFSGIGSGVGAMAAGGPSPNGLQAQALSTSSTPVHRDDAGESVAASAARMGEELKAIRTGSRGGRKGKKVKSEEGKVESEDGDGRSTPGALNGRGTKRSKHAHHGHHHHIKHHHHHHHQKGDDDELGSGSPALGAAPPPHTAGAIMRTMTPSGLSTSTAATAHHHHHHHHHHAHQPHHHHHHHHTDPNSLTPVPRPASPYVPPRKAITTIRSQPVLDSVASLPRHHLGSTLYAPSLSVSKASSLLDRFGYASTPRPLPRFDEGKANCTFTLRIPRYYLRHDSREEIVRRRAVWGSDIYTDDSDVLAALVHAGWVRGAWGVDVDESLLDLDDGGGGDDGGAEKEAQADTTGDVLTGPPARGPMLPLKNRDLHVTLLILPALQSYAATVRRGLRSRSWGGDHDGMSFRVERIEWVDGGFDGVGEEEERGGEARRKRLKRLRNLRRDAGKAVKIRGGNVGVGGKGKENALEGTWAVEVMG